MKYHIDTIPVWDAYKAGGECPLCDIFVQNEKNYIDVYLGASYMEPDRRIEVNERGFCMRHNAMLFGAQNRLGLALMTHTHLKSVIKKQAADFTAIEQSLLSGGLKRMLNRKKEDAVTSGVKDIERQIEKCAICEQLETTMNRYIYTLIHMYKHETAFKEAFKASKGMCMPHFARAMVMVDAEGGSVRAEIIGDLIALQRANYDRLEKELEWFTLKFDYRNVDKPWGNSEDALERTINKLVGKTI